MKDYSLNFIDNLNLSTLDYIEVLLYKKTVMKY